MVFLFPAGLQNLCFPGQLGDKLREPDSLSDTGN